MNRNTNYEKKIREKIKDKEDDLSKLLKLKQTQAVQNTIKRKEAEIKTLYDELEENLVNAKTDGSVRWRRTPAGQ